MAVVGLDFTIEFQFALGILQAAGFPISRLQLLVNVVTIRVKIGGGFEILNGFVGIAVPKQLLT